MKNFLRILVFVFSSLLVNPPAFALSLQDCQQASLNNSKLLQAYKNLIKASLFGNKKDKAATLPQLTATYEPSRLQYNNRSEFSDGTQSKYGLVFSWDLQKLLADYPILSRLEIEKDRLLQSVAESEIKKEVTQNYFRLYILLKKKNGYLEADHYFKKHIQDIEDLQSRGLDVTLDLSRVRVQQNTFNMSLLNTNSEIIDLLLALNSQMETQYTETDFSSMEVPELDQILSDAQVQDVEQHILPQLGRLQQSQVDAADMKSAEGRFRQNRFYYLPSLQLGMERNSHTIDPAVEESRTYLTLSFDIFDFGQKANESRELKSTYEYQKDLFAENQRKLKLHIEQLLNEIKNLKLSYQSASDNLQNAKGSLDTAQVYYRQGKIKEIDVLSTLSDYLNVKDQTYEMLYDLLSKKVELDSVIQGTKQ